MSVKTCEEYVVSELVKLKAEIDEYKDQLNEYSKDPRMFNKGDFVSLLKQKGKFYSSSTIYRSDIEGLEEKVGTDKFIEALTNDEVAEEIGSISMGWGNKGINVNSITYELMIAGDRYTYVITNFDDEDYSSSIYKIDDDEYSLDEEVIHKNTLEKFRRRIKEYLDSKEDNGEED